MKMELPISESIEVEVSIVVIDCENPPLFPCFMIVGINNSVLEINMFSIPISSASAFFLPSHFELLKKSESLSPNLQPKLPSLELKTKDETHLPFPFYSPFRLILLVQYFSRIQ